MFVLQRLLPKKLANELKMVSFFLMKRESSHEDEVFSFECFPPKKDAVWK